MDFTAPVANRTRSFVRMGSGALVLLPPPPPPFPPPAPRQQPLAPPLFPVSWKVMDALCLVLEFLSYEQIVRSSRYARSGAAVPRDKLDEWALVEPIKGHAYWGLKGRSFGKMRGPSSVSATSDGGLLVVDFLNRRIQVLHELRSDSNGSIKVHRLPPPSTTRPATFPRESARIRMLRLFRGGQSVACYPAPRTSWSSFCSARWRPAGQVRTLWARERRAVGPRGDLCRR